MSELLNSSYSLSWYDTYSILFCMEKNLLQNFLVLLSNVFRHGHSSMHLFHNEKCVCFDRFLSRFLVNIECLFPHQENSSERAL
jgi:hypothetical protein